MHADDHLIMNRLRIGSQLFHIIHNSRRYITFLAKAVNFIYRHQRGMRVNRLYYLFPVSQPALFRGIPFIFKEVRHPDSNAEIFKLMLRRITIRSITDNCPIPGRHRIKAGRHPMGISCGESLFTGGEIFGIAVSRHLHHRA